MRPEILSSTDPVEIDELNEDRGPLTKDVVMSRRRRWRTSFSGLLSRLRDKHDMRSVLKIVLVEGTLRLWLLEHDTYGLSLGLLCKGKGLTRNKINYSSMERLPPIF